MLRTWLVRFDAIELTLSVRSFQVPATPGTSAWPPSFPSVPTSRATRVTSSANSRRVSVSELIVSASSATSPFAETVIFCDRSPCAMAVVTCAMERTWPVRFAAMTFTLSVRSRQVPETPRTSAWPPSFPSVPTSRATRVTSSANDDSWSTMVFTARPMRRNSPRSGRPSISFAMCWDRSPSATATITRAISVVGRPRSSIRLFTARTPSAQAPSKCSSSTRSVIRPSRPTTRPMRRSSRFRRSSNVMTSLNRSATSPAAPVRRGIRTLKSPSRTRCSASASAASTGASPSRPVSSLSTVVMSLLTVAGGVTAPIMARSGPNCDPPTARTTKPRRGGRLSSPRGCLSAPGERRNAPSDAGHRQAGPDRSPARPPCDRPRRRSVGLNPPFGGHCYAWQPALLAGYVSPRTAVRRPPPVPWCGPYSTRLTCPYCSTRRCC